LARVPGDGTPIHGTLTVPRSWGRPDAGTLELPILRYPCLDAGGEPPTVVLLAGGPGESGCAEAETGSHRPVVQALRHDADVIAFDQRGACGSQPQLSSVTSWELPLDVAVSRDEALERARELTRRSVELWKSDGLDARDFDVHLTSLDVRALLDGLEVDRVSLFGASYGTQLGLNVLRENPERVRACVFVGVEAPHQTIKLPAEVDRVIERILQMSSKEPATPYHAFRSLLQRLDTAPLHTVLADGRTIAVGGFELRRVVAKHIGRPRFARRLAAATCEWEAGEFAAIAPEIVLWKEGPYGGLHHVVDTASGISPTRLEQVDAQRSETCLGDAVDFPLPYVADEYGLNDLGEEFRARFQSPAPILFVSGGLDARTPPSNVDEILPSFPNAVHHVEEGAMHDLGDYTDDRRLLARLREGVLA
jgi:pimeloyl-ACP methyl ester carboxylesterase